MKKEKKLTVISWDADYRERLEDSFECLRVQTVLDQLDIIHLEWTDKKKPEVLKYDFIKLVNMNLEKDISQTPSYDTGLQWNLGVYLSNTDWVSMHHNDLIPADHYEKILHKIDRIKQQNNNIIYFEGWTVNQSHLFISRAAHQSSYGTYKKKVGTDFHLIPDLFKNENTCFPIANGVSCTAYKPKIIQEIDGYCWNMPGRDSEHWCGLGYPRPNLNGRGTRRWLLDSSMAHVACPEIYTFGIPHPTSAKHKTPSSNRLYPGGMKHYSHLVDEWVPVHLPQISFGGVNNV